jgi:hypothetical protein
MKGQECEQSITALAEKCSKHKNSSSSRRRRRRIKAKNDSISRRAQKIYMLGKTENKQRIQIEPKQQNNRREN